MIVVSLYSRKFCVSKKSDEEYQSFIIREVPPSLVEKQEIVADALLLENNLILNVKVTLSISKILKNKMIAFKMKRRKRYHKAVGYSQYVAYFKIKEITK